MYYAENEKNLAVLTLIVRKANNSVTIPIFACGIEFFVSYSRIAHNFIRFATCHSLLWYLRFELILTFFTIILIVNGWLFAWMEDGHVRTIKLLNFHFSNISYEVLINCDLNLGVLHSDLLRFSDKKKLL